MSSEDPHERLRRGMDAMGAAMVEILDAVGALDEERAWARDGHTSMTPWLCMTFRLTWGTAREYVFLARRLRELPLLRRALMTGRVSLDQMRPLARLATPETERAWLEDVEDREPARLWLEWQRRQRPRAADAEEDHRARRLWMGWDEERRFLHLSGDLPGEQGEAFERAVRARGKDIEVEDEAIDRSGARLADAVTELVTGAGARPVPANVVVHVDADVLGGHPSDGELRVAETGSGTQLCDDAARRLACDGRIEWHIRRGDRLMGIGVGGRKPPGWMMRALEHRDRDCRFPGCGRTTFLHAHHLIHWARGGPTELSNLVLLCTAHHRMLHEAGWGTSGHPDVDLRFHDPTGRPVGLRARSRASPERRAA